MQEVSEAWKEAHKQMLLPETKVELSLSIADIETMNEPSEVQYLYTTEEISDLENCLGSPRIDDVPKRAILERNTWVLDGSRSVIDEKENYKGIGIVGDLTDGLIDGRPAKAEVWIYAHERMTDAGTREWVGKAIPGLTIVWDTENEHFPTTFYVDFKVWGSDIVASTTITDNTSVVSKIDLDVPDGWNWVVIATPSGPPDEKYTEDFWRCGNWAQPNRRPRIDRIYLGQELVFDKNQILSYSHEQSGDPLSSETSNSRIEFTLDNTETNWNMLAPTGIEKYFFNQYPISVRYGMDVGGNTEWIKGGSFFLSDWKVSPDGFSSSFTAEDVFGFFRNQNYSRLGVSATVLRNTSTYTDLDGTVGEEGSTLLSGSTWLVNDAALGVLDHSSGESTPMLYVHMNGAWYEWAKASDMKINTSTTIGDLVRDAYGSSSASATVTPSFDSSIDDISGPYFVEKTPISEVLQKCANVASCGLWQTRDGVLMMQPVDTTLSDYRIPLFLAYSHPKIELTKPLKGVSIIRHSLYSNEDDISTTYSVGESGETIEMNNSYVIDSSVERGLAENIASLWKPRTIVSGEFRADPRLDLFDIVTVETKYGELAPVVITNIKYSYDGSFKGSYTGRVIDVS